ncbi:MAG: DUF5067 domain-containing protein [Lactobacillaceae bacterium]|jgi:hypothetical protein|nr:DUF5067 domain-containing protein [Lactobacillaceae bacterium]
MKVKVKKPFYKKWWVWVIVVFVVLPVMAAVAGGGDEEADATATVSTAKIDNATKDRDAISEKYNALDVTGKSYSQVKEMILKIDKLATIKEKNTAGDTIHMPDAKVTEITYHKILDYVEVFTDVKPTKTTSETKAGSTTSAWDDATKTYTGKNAILKIDSAEKSQDFEGKPVMDINFTVTNTGNKVMDVQMLFLEVANVIQNNGTTSNTLEYAIKMDGADDHLSDQLNPGATTSGTYSFSLEDETTPVTIEFKQGSFYKKDAEYKINQ